MKTLFALTILLFMSAANAEIIDHADGYYDFSNWNQTLNGGEIYEEYSPSLVMLISNNSRDATWGSSNPPLNEGPYHTDFTIVALQNGVVKFDWLYSTSDIDGPSLDPFGYLLNGVFNQLSINVIAEYEYQPFEPQSGTASFAVRAGDIFGFRAISIDAIEGSSETKISSFSVTTVPVPATIPLFALGMICLAFFRKSRGSLKVRL